MKDSFLFLADGFEEVEALTPVDLLRRAGIPVKTVSITSSLQVKGAHGVTVNADLIYDNTLFAEAEWLILPGGMPGAENLYNFAPLQGLLKQHAASGGHIAAICASPAVVLGQLGLLKGLKATCYPGFEHLMKGATPVDKPVVVSRNYVLGNGPGNAMKWALKIVLETLGEEAEIHIANQLLLYPLATKGMEHYFG